MSTHPSVFHRCTQRRRDPHPGTIVGTALAADMARILSDPRLTWLTDPALNEAGEDVHVKELTGG